jgi:hypothetical protein
MRASVRSCVHALCVRWCVRACVLGACVRACVCACVLGALNVCSCAKFARATRLTWCSCHAATCVSANHAQVQCALAAVAAAHASVRNAVSHAFIVFIITNFLICPIPLCFRPSHQLPPLSLRDSNACADLPTLSNRLIRVNNTFFSLTQFGIEIRLHTQGR